MTAPRAESEPRTEHFPTSGPVELEVHVGSGSVLVELVELSALAVDVVEVTVQAGPGSWWQQGLSGMLSMLGAGQGDTAGRTDPAGLGSDAVTTTHISFSPSRQRLVVRSPQAGAARAVPLDVQITAPAGSRVLTRTGSASVEVTGTAGSVDSSAGSGEVTVQDVAHGVDVRTGSGAVRAGHLAEGGRIRTGSGDLVVDAAAGELDLVTGSGDLRIGIAAGVLAELDVRSGSGTARCELPIVDSDDAADTATVRARTGSGNALVHGAH